MNTSRAGDMAALAITALRSCAMGCALAAMLAGGKAVVAQPVDAAGVRIGISAPLSGRLAGRGVPFVAGARACLAASEPGVTLEVHDDGGEPARAVAHVRAMAGRSEIVALIGAGDADVTAALLPLLASARLPMIGAPTGAESLREDGSPWLFHVRAGHRDEGAAIMVQFDEQGVDGIALVHSADMGGRDLAERLRIEAARLAKRVVFSAALADDPGPAVRGTIQADAQAVLVLVRPAAAIAFVRALRAGGGRQQVFVLSETGDDTFVQDLGSEARGVGVAKVLPSPAALRSVLVRDYRAALAAADGLALVGDASLEGCAYARVAALALRRAGRHPSRATTEAALAGGEFDIGGFLVRFRGAERRGSRHVEVAVVGADGRLRR